MEAKRKKASLAVASVALVAVLAIAGTFAYLQDSTENVTNTFKTNEVKVALEETTGENYNIVPGTTETKDPKVTVTATVNSYVFVKVDDKTKGLVTYEIADGWEQLEDANGAIVEGVFYRTVEANEKLEGVSVLKDDKVSYSASLTNNDMEKLGESGTLTFTAYAIQQEGFENAAAAYQMKSAVYTNDAAAAKAALGAGNSVVLSDDINFNDYEEKSESSSLYVNGKKAVTIDLNGKTITGRSGSKYNNTIKATNGAVITINGSGTVIGGSAASSSSSNNAIEVTKGGKVIVNGGTYTVGSDKNGNGNSVIYSDGGDVVINDGFFYTNTAYNGIYWLLNKKDGSKGSIVCYGGTFVNFDPSKTGTEPAGESDDFVAEGYKVVSEAKENGDTWYTVVKDGD